MGLWKKLGLLQIFTAKDPGELATGIYLAASEDNKKKRKQEEVECIESEWKMCYNCFSHVEDNSDYCPYCGNVLKVTPPKIITTNRKTKLYELNGEEIVDFSDFLDDGTYKIIEPGEYLFFSPTGTGTFGMSIGEESENIEAEEIDDNCANITSMYLDLPESSYIDFKNGYLIKTNQYNGFEFKYIIGGVSYRIGIDKPAGVYTIKLRKDFDVGNFRLYNGPMSLLQDNLITVCGIENSIKYELEEGIYIYLDYACELELVEEY